MKKSLLLALAVCVGGIVSGQVKKMAPDRASSTVPVEQLQPQQASNLAPAASAKKAYASTTTPKPRVRTCFTVENQLLRQQQDRNLPSAEEFERWIQGRIEENKRQTSSGKQAAAVYRIPVIIHIVHNGEPVGVGANISAAQAYSQIEVLTEDFRRQNPDATNTPAEFLGVAADFEIEFVPATLDLNGNLLAEPGIHRYNGNRASWDTNTDIETILKPATSWDPARYCNMWTLNFGGSMNGTLGYAQFPEGSALPGMPIGTQSSSTDGLVMGYQYFGSSAKDPGGQFNLYAPFDLGRTATHEIGHWLGLRHIWADDRGGCTADDYVNDTPYAASENYGCTPTVNSCTDMPINLPDMVQNYMDYSDDACMNLFTQGQKARAVAVLTNSPRRAELPASPAYVATTNDAGITSFNYKKSCDGQVNASVMLTNFSTSSTLNTAVIVVEANGQEILRSNWSGSLSALNSSLINLPVFNLSQGLHQVRVFTLLPNGNTDSNNLNNASSAPISISMYTGNYAQNFESGPSSLNGFSVSSGTESEVGIAALAARNSNFGLYLTGKSANGYPASGTGPTEAQAFDPAHLHYAAAMLCYDATNAASLQLSFDYYLNFLTNNAYTNFRYRVIGENGTTYSSGLIRPAGADKLWTTVNLNLSAFTGTRLQLIFEANCKYGAADNSVLIENIQLTYTTSLPEISFSAATGAVSEASATTSDGTCRTYIDYTTSLVIANAPTTNATVNVTATSGTATNTSDYQVLTPTVTFTAGNTTSQPVRVRVYDDLADEATEELVLQISNRSNAVISAGNAIHTLTLADNDNALGPFTSPQVLLTEDFTDDLTGWTTIPFSNHEANSPNTWRAGTQIIITGKSAYVSQAANKSGYAQNKITDVALRSPLIIGTNLTSLEVAFSYRVGGEYVNRTYYDYGQLLYALESDPTTYYIVDGPYQGNGISVNRKTLMLPTSLNGKRFYLAWNWINDNSAGTEPALAIDDISVIGQAAVETVAINLNSQKNVYLGPYATAHFYDQTDGKLIASIENTSSWDYGCTSITIDRSGLTSTDFWNAGVDKSMVDKTVYITPTTNNPSGSYNITLYYTESEIAGWEARSGKNRSLLKVAKISGARISDVTPTRFPAGATGDLSRTNTLAAFGKDWAVKGSFATGFSGFAAGDPGLPPVISLPVALVNFSGTAQENNALLSWTTNNEKDAAVFEVEHSTDGTSFTKVGAVAAAGNSVQEQHYSFSHSSLSNGLHYYRLRMVDVDGTFEYSTGTAVTIGALAPAGLVLHPNPAQGFVTLALTAKATGTATVSVVSAKGVVVASRNYQVQQGLNQLKASLQGIPAGLYLVQVTDGHQTVQQKLIIH